MHLEVVRKKYFKNCSIGQLWLDGEFFCFTLEDTVREVEGRPVSEWKVLANTAIPYGRYFVKLTQSYRFKVVMPEILNVPGFTGVRIHTGNSASNTEGCILVGMTWDGHNEYIGSSKIAFEKLMAKLEKEKDEILLIVR